MRKFATELAASERAAKLLMASGKLTGWVTKGEIVRKMGGEVKAAEDTIDTLMVYGWMKRRNRNGVLVYGITTKEEVQRRNLEELLLIYKNQLLIIGRNAKRTKKIKRAADRRALWQSIKTFISTKWNTLTKS